MIVKTKLPSIALSFSGLQHCRPIYSWVRRERRRNVRCDYNALVTITLDDGFARGARYVGLLRNLSDGGFGVLLDCASLRHGISVTVGIQGLPAISRRVCHCTALDEGTLVGVSFAYADVPVDD